jgi:hypothetical protein
MCGRSEDELTHLGPQLGRIEAHHIRKLANVQPEGRRALPDWKKRMIAIRRKTLIVCTECHDNIHAGRLCRPRTEAESEDIVSGEPDALKGARPVRRGEMEKERKPPRQLPTLLHYYEGLAPEEDIKEIAAQTAALCVKDHRGPRGHDDFPTPGDGEVDHRSMLTTLRAAGFSGPCLVELVGGSTPEETEHEARRALAHVQDIIVPPAAGGAGSGGRLPR